MKLTIENQINTTGKKSVDNQIKDELFMFIQIITNCNTEAGLRHFIRGGNNFTHFMYGFGGGHLWVKQIIDGEPKQQVIFVQF